MKYQLKIVYKGQIYNYDCVDMIDAIEKASSFVGLPSSYDFNCELNIIPETEEEKSIDYVALYKKQKRIYERLKEVDKDFE